MSQPLCSRCGSPLPENARFCPSCGWPIVPEGLSEERKVVTVLFADLARSTQLAASLDPERFREVLGAFYRSASDEVEAVWKPRAQREGSILDIQYFRPRDPKLRRKRARSPKKSARVRKAPSGRRRRDVGGSA